MTSTEPSERTSEERYEQLVNLSPSAKYTDDVLQREGTLTQDELAEQTLLPKRTVQYALDNLLEKGLVEQAVDASDARRREYTSREVTRPDDP